MSCHLAALQRNVGAARTKDRWPDDGREGGVRFRDAAKPWIRSPGAKGMHMVVGEQQPRPEAQRRPGHHSGPITVRLFLAL